MSNEDYERACDAEHLGVELSIDESEFADVEDFLSDYHSVVEPKWKVMAKSAGSMMIRGFASIGRTSNYTYDIWGLNPVASRHLEDWHQ